MSDGQPAPHPARLAVNVTPPFTGAGTINVPAVMKLLATFRPSVPPCARTFTASATSVPL